MSHCSGRYKGWELASVLGRKLGGKRKKEGTDIM